ncbi:MAG: GNAT family N-acetyltransferase [Anaerolineae bacterium]|jgi:GNAT superfamily N-acetyltransferase
MPFEIVPLEGKHLPDAAGLASARYRALREQVPAMPTRYEDPGSTLPWLQDLASQAPGVAAIRNGRLAGFLLGMVIPQFRGKRGVFSPEWANAADLEDSRWLYEEMYARLSARWVADGCVTHLISLLAHDRPGIEGWHGLGFGLAAADGVRAVDSTPDLDPVPGPNTEIEIRQASPDDVEQMRDLLTALVRHMMSAPTFLFRREPDRLDEHAAWLADPANALWLAWQGDSVVAGMGQGPANPDACDVIADDRTTSIVSAYTQPSARGGGIATALLDRVLARAREGGFERCAVDWEPMNILAHRFWTRHFQPVCYALARQIDERLC